MRNNYLEYFVLYYKKIMTFSTSFEIFVLCCFPMQHCFCMVATVMAVLIASMVGTVSLVNAVSMVSTVSMVGTVSMINTVFTLILIWNTLYHIKKNNDILKGYFVGVCVRLLRRMYLSMYWESFTHLQLMRGWNR